MTCDCRHAVRLIIKYATMHQFTLYSIQFQLKIDFVIIIYCTLARKMKERIATLI